MTKKEIIPPDRCCERIVCAEPPWAEEGLCQKPHLNITKGWRPKISGPGKPMAGVAPKPDRLARWWRADRTRAPPTLMVQM
jgi:hypothetical protein